MMSKISKISSPKNSRILGLGARGADWFVFEGEKIVADLVKLKVPIDVIVVQEGTRAAESVLSLDDERIGEIWLVGEAVLKKLSDLRNTPSSIAFTRHSFTAAAVDLGSDTIVLDNLQDPGNLGTILRCAAAFDFHQIVLTGSGVRLHNRKVLRASQNAIFNLQICSYDHIGQFLQSIGDHPVHIYGTTSRPAKGSIDLHSVHRPAIIVFGNEGSGLDDGLLARIRKVTIAHSPRIESLNVGVCACITMYELGRKIGSSPPDVSLGKGPPVR